MSEKKELFVNRWNTAKGQDYYKEILSNLHDYDLLTKIANKYFGIIDEYLDLRGIDLHGRDLSNADLTYCDLRYSDFSDIVATEAIFAFSDISDSLFERAEFNISTLAEITAKNVLFRESVITTTSFNHSILCGSDFSLARINRTDMVLCDFENCILDKIELDDVSLSSTKIPKSQKKWIIANDGKYYDDPRNIEWI
jgi:uncharacterized protein YjbI with pentapeptide repeats